MVKKKDCSSQPCSDYHQLTLQMLEGKYPLPNMVDLAARMEGCTIFNKLDLRKRYLKVFLVAAADAAKTAITTSFGIFKFI
jgi:hypothetical protein